MSPPTCFTRLALSLLALGAAASPPAWADKDRTVPFKASVTTQEVLTMGHAALKRCPASGLLGTTTGQGTASYMDAVSLVATDCPVTLDGVNFFFRDGQMTLTAANGDRLKAIYSGTLLPVPGTDPVVHAINGTFSVTGGTGRFGGARGGGSLQGTEDLATLKGSYQVDGTLTLKSKSDRD